MVYNCQYFIIPLTINKKKLCLYKMSKILDEFYKRKRILESLRYNEEIHRIKGFSDWLEQDEIIAKIISDINSNINIEEIMENCGHDNPPSVSTPKEIAAVGLYLMKRTRENKGLHDAAYEYGIMPNYSTNTIQDFSDEVMERYITPTIEYIEETLEKLEEEVSLSELISQKTKDIYSESFNQDYPLTSNQLYTVSQEFQKIDKEGSWQNIGNSCREILKIFCDEFINKHNIQLPDELKKSDVKNIIKIIIPEGFNKHRFNKSLLKLIESIWDHAQSITHRNSTNRKEAIRLYIWTQLALEELLSLSS